MAIHVREVDNAATDALLRNRDDMVISLCPQAHPLPTQLPLSLVAPLLDRELNWTSTRWAFLVSQYFAGGVAQRPRVHIA